MDKDVFQELAPVVASTLGIDRQRVLPETSAPDVEGWDSLNHFRLTTAVEMHFSIRLTMEEVMSLENVGDLAALVFKHRSAA